MTHCRLCSSASFDAPVVFRGSTEIYRQMEFGYARCLDCGSINLMGEVKVDYSAYPNRDWVPAFERQRLIRFLRSIGITRQHSILDYGCGQGVITESLRRAGYSKADGYEPHHPRFGGIPRSSYDLILLIHVLEHFSDFEEFIDHLAELMCEDTKVVLICPRATSIDRIESGCPYLQYIFHAPYHTVIPSDSGIRQIFGRSGLKLDRLIGHDIQKSGRIFNNRVYSRFMKDLGGTKEAALRSSLIRKSLCVLGSPIDYFRNFFWDTTDTLVGTSVFSRSSPDE